MVDARPGESPFPPVGPCRSCGSPVAEDQRYCLECGALAGERRLDPLEMLGARTGSAPAPVAPQPAPRAVPLAAAATAILVAGISGALVTGDGGARAAIVTRAPAAVVAAAPPATTTSEKQASSSSSSSDAPADDASADDTAAEDDASVDTAGTDTSATDDTAADTPVPDDAGDDSAGSDVPEDDPVIPPHVWLLAVQGPRAQEAVDRVADRGVRLTALQPVSASVSDSATALITGLRPTAAGADPAAPATPAAAPGATTTTAAPATTTADAAEPAPPLPEALTSADQTWRTYIDVQPKDQPALSGTCAAGADDPAVAPLAARSPFRTIASLQADGACAKAVRSLESLGDDVSAGTIPSFSYVSLGGCAAPERSVVALPDQVDDTITAITESTEFQENGLVVVTSVGADDPCPVPGAPVVPSTAVPGPVPTVVLEPTATAGSKLDTAGDLLAVPRLVATTLGVSAPGVSGAADVPALELPGVEAPAATGD